MSKYKGNIVSATQTVLSGTNYTGKANGVFKLAEQIQAKQSSLWAKGLNVPLAPTIGTATFGNTNASVAFTAPSDTGGTSILDYTVTSTPGNFTATGASSPLTVTGLTNGTNYTFTVRARNTQGNSPESAASNSTGITTPGVPTIGTAVYGDASATVNFTAPASNGGSAILDYTVTSTPGNFTATGTGTSIVVTGLTNGTAYTFTVKARNVVGYSNTSASSNSVTPTGNTVPSAPTIGAATLTGQAATVTFTAPLNTGGLPITEYTVTAYPGGATAVGTTTSITISGLIFFTNYTFKVKAKNSLGYGAESSASNSLQPIPAPGDSFGGGYYAGKILDAGTTYALIIPSTASFSPASGIALSTTSNALPSATRTLTNGPAASASMNSSNYPAAYYCESLTLNGYTDWYLPARDELEIVYRNLKPSTAANATYARASTGFGGDGATMGTNANSIPTQPGYTSSSPAQNIAKVNLTYTGTGAAAGNAYYWSSTENATGFSWLHSMSTGYQTNGIPNDQAARFAMPMRRVAI
jgi:hypothetical protein